MEPLLEGLNASGEVDTSFKDINNSKEEVKQESDPDEEEMKIEQQL